MKKAFNRIRRLIDLFSDLNPNIEEIKKDYGYIHNYSFYPNNYFLVKTKLGEKCIDINYSKTQLTFGNKQSCYPQQLGCFRSYNEKLYSLLLNTNNNTVDISPNLDSESPMNEEQIYNSIVEIENIFNRYDFKTKSEEHKFNLNKFIERFK